MIIDVFIEAFDYVRLREPVVLDLARYLIIRFKIVIFEVLFWLESTCAFTHKVLVLNIFWRNCLLLKGFFFESLLLFFFVLALVVSVLMIHAVVEILVIELFILSI